ncbi:C-C motif chemokine 24 [Galemys pyrenaicus]|uniref:C-C motif chemokine n=1 Tax=Galemys pyrenaicus TaxID=202257 RepID=A0A8J6A1F1_GALPY|nr:C-C motif chemokine 24 [Galemys pyrenaicus]
MRLGILRENKKTFSRAACGVDFSISAALACKIDLIMAGPTTLFAILLLLALCAHCIVPVGSVVIPSSCCIFFISKKIPERLVVSYQVFSASVCPKAGVIFTTKKGKKVCANPKDHWVQRYMRNLEAKGRKTSVGTEPMGAKAAARRRPGNGTSV